MSDLFIIATAAQLAMVTNHLARIDLILGHPCCGCNEIQNQQCTCARHVHPDGSPASHVGSCTLRHARYRTHPTDGRIAVHVDAVITWIRNHQSIVDTKLTATQRNQLFAAIDAAAQLTIDWFPVSAFT